MPTITIKNIPPELYAKLKESAEKNRRSINSEVIMCIEKAVTSQQMDTDMILERARILREKTSAYRLTEEEITQAKNEGRP